MGGGGWFDVFENLGSFPGSPEGLAWPWRSSHLPTKAAPSRGRRVSALSAGDAQSLWPVVSLRTGCLDSKEKREGEREACPQDSEGSHSGSVM